MVIDNNYQSSAVNYTNSYNSKKPKITWENYFSNYLNEDFEDQFEVKKGSPKEFAEKYNLTIIRLPATSEDIMLGNNLFSPFTVKEGFGLNKTENSISLIPGTNIDLGNGMVIRIKDNIVDIFCKDDGLYNEDNYINAGKMAAALNKFIRYANGQSGSFGFDNEQRKLVISVLEKMGINTRIPFEVNHTHFSTTERGASTLEKMGVDPSNTILPDYMMKQVISRYESNSKWI
ncbi:hypothetical protein SAMN05660297_01182 [Natronincola peptidivorans]|uniref:Uncharacterized protein n=1 Tax=Natronincola peptidivorans TaxID=426128 RepID=A0A1I0B460_9FIRM|nr:hypothetical protein [Natronincola peptidivorans]SET00892.1 hypothetical protein SAMN05660297_01182 [Natronincola peptidivorans]